ncbi:MAG: calcium/sodium antiporter [Victivallales bacterium]|nr:calcium/sodium antiporter [Victivallales bacterium]
MPIFFIAIALVALYYGAEWLVDGGSGIALRLKISPMVIGLTLVACATSAPELTVSLDSAWQGLDGMALGNVIGSNICNIALILGLTALVKPIAVNFSIFRLEMPLMLLATVLLAALTYFCGGVSRLPAMAMLTLLGAYMWWNVHQARRGKEPADASQEVEVPRKLRPAWQYLLLALAGLVFLVGGGKLFVAGAVELARLMHVSETVIGLTIVAVGTSLPELATSLVAALKGEQDLAIGNVVGSNVFNILCIVGLTAAIRPLKAMDITLVDLATMLAATFLLPPMMLTDRKISRPEGALLLLIYVGYLVVLVKAATGA